MSCSRQVPGETPPSENTSFSLLSTVARIVFFTPTSSDPEEVKRFVEALRFDGRVEVVVRTKHDEAIVAALEGDPHFHQMRMRETHAQAHNHSSRQLITAAAQAATGTAPPLIPTIAACAFFSVANAQEVLQFTRMVQKRRPDCFLMTLGDEAVLPSSRLLACDDHGVHMASNVAEHIQEVLRKLVDEIEVSEQQVPKYACGICGKPNLTQRQLWTHLPLYHVNVKKNVSLAEVPCPLCPAMRSRQPFIQHFHEEHAPPGVEVEHGRSVVEIVSFGLCVIRRKSDKKFLVVQEYCNQGFWLPGGGIDSGEMPTTAAIREAKEEAGIDVNLTGVLRVECSPPRAGGRYMRMRYIFYGEPVDEAQPPKTFPDYESVGACWVSADEIATLKLRGSEPLEWFEYVARGGAIHPLSLLTHEGAPVQMPKSTST